jgi:hypothetical protein
MKTLTARRMSALSIVAYVFMLLITPNQSWAQQRFKFFFKDAGGITKYTEQHAIDVGDVPGHQIRVATLQTKHGSEAPDYDGVKVSESTAWLTSDYVAGSGHFTEYSVSLMANGDKIFSRVEGLSQTTIGADGGRKTSYSAVTTLTGGTGKFATVRGTIRSSGSTDFKTGVTGNPSEGEYWFEK